MAPDDTSAPELPAGVSKELLTPGDDGESRRPKKGDEVTVHYVGRLPGDNGTEFDSSRSRDEPLTFKLGKGQVIKGWDLAVATMCKGELSRFVVLPEYAYGEKGAPPKIPADATLVFDIELLSWKAEGDLFEDGSVLRTSLYSGSGYNSMPKEGAEVCCSLKVASVDGQILKEYSRLNYVLGSGQLGLLSRAADRALQEMKKDGTISVRCVGGHDYDVSVHKEVVMDISLHHVFEMMDVSPDKDGSIMKRSLQEGSGDYCKPREGGHVQIMVEMLTDARGESVPGFPERFELQFTVGNGEVCDAVEYAALEFHKQERASISADPSMFEGLPTWPFGDISGKLSLVVELIDFNNGKASWDMSSEEKLAYAQGRKEVAGKLHKEQKYRPALRRYTRAVEFLEAHVTVVEGAAELILLCQLNQAACLLKLNDPSAAKVACSSVLEVDAGNVKALYRRASAYLELHEFAEAVKDLREVLVLDPVNKEAQRLLVQARGSAKEAKKKEMNMYVKMNKAFSGLAEAEQKSIKDAKEAHSADLERKSAAAKAEAKKWREGRGKNISAAESKDDMLRASQSMAEMQKNVRRMEMVNRGLIEEDD